VSEHVRHHHPRGAALVRHDDRAHRLTPRHARRNRHDHHWL